MRKYSRLKEKYYETDFIDDADQKTKVEGSYYHAKNEDT